MTWLPVLVPALGGVVLAVVARAVPAAGRRVPLGLTATGLLVATTALSVVVAVQRSSVAYRWIGPLEISLAVDDTAAVVGVLVPAVALVVVAYAAAHEADVALVRLVATLVAFVGAMELLVLAGDVLTLLIAWELVGAFSWTLIGHDRRQADKGQAANQAFVVTRAGDLGLFVAVGAAFAGIGSLSYGDLPRLSGGWLGVFALGVLVAAASKSGQVPFSPWLFSAMGGPTSVSALLHAATMVAAGAYVLIRLQPVLSGVAWFGPAAVAVGLTTALAGGVVAVVQDHPKKLLAGSTSAQYGLMFVAVGAGYPAVALAHLVAHAALKAPLFMAAGVAMEAVEGERLTAMRLGRALPVVAVGSAICAAALAGVPPLGAAWTKEEIVSAAGHMAEWLAVLVAVAGGLSAAYATRFQLLAFGPADGTDRGLRRRPTTVERVAIGVGATTTVALGLLWLPGGSSVVEDVTGGALPEGQTWELALSLLLVAAGAYAALVVARREPSRARQAWPPAAVDWLGLPRLARIAVVDPTLRASAFLGTVDDRVVDLLPRAVAGGGALLSRTASAADGAVVDAGVRTVARLARWTSRVSDRVAEVGFDGLARGVAGLLGAAGSDVRRHHTGLAHQFYVLVAVGAAALVAVAALWR